VKDDPLVVRALRGATLERPPVWFMRQAGRYLPEYRAVRKTCSFLDLCHDADLACEVTLQPLRRFELDAAIVFSDILTVLQAVGRTVTFEAGEGPTVDPVRDAAGIDALVRPDVSDALPTAPETIRRFRRARPQTPILGFAGAPFTLLCYLVEGGGSKNWTHVKRFLYADPAAAQRALDLLADVVGDHLQDQVDAGAAAIQLFDTWAGALSPDDLERWALPSAARALSRVRGAPRLYFTKDTAPALSRLHQTGADAFGLDWRVDVREARVALGADVPVQGNLDPIALFAPPAVIRRKVQEILVAAGPTGHVFNLGHGVVPETPIEGVEVMVATAREGYAAARAALAAT
jgi:uroporphyrinogen decarboxylase